MKKIAYLLLVACFNLLSTQKANATHCQKHIKQMSQQGYYFTSKEVLSFAKRARKSGFIRTKKHKRLLKKYDQIIKRIRLLRLCYRKVYLRTNTHRRRKAILKEFEKELLLIAKRIILPLWLGTPWEFYGTSMKPHQTSIACGYFVLQVLRAFGFRFPQYHRFGGKHIFRFAKLPAYKMISLLARKSQTHTFGLYGLRKKHMQVFRRHGPGIYLFGLSYHVGLLLWDGKKVVFWHSDGFEPRQVKAESIKSSYNIQTSTYFVIGKLSLHALRKLLLARPVWVP